MNYLAHVFLARHSELAMIGGILGDFGKMCDLQSLPEEVVLEIRMHREIDKFTDAHPSTRLASRLFRDHARRFSGILIDLFYDHCLAIRWNRYSTVPLGVFAANFYSALQRNKHHLPPTLVNVLPRLMDEDWLSSYRHFDAIERAAHRMSRRISRKGELLVEGLEDLKVNRLQLEDQFAPFFEELQQHADLTRLRIYQGGSQAVPSPLWPKRPLTPDTQP